MGKIQVMFQTTNQIRLNKDCVLKNMHYIGDNWVASYVPNYQPGKIGWVYLMCGAVIHQAPSHRGTVGPFGDPARSERVEGRRGAWRLYGAGALINGAFTPPHFYRI